MSANPNEIATRAAVGTDKALFEGTDGITVALTAQSIADLTPSSGKGYERMFAQVGQVDLDIVTVAATIFDSGLPPSGLLDAVLNGPIGGGFEIKIPMKYINADVGGLDQLRMLAQLTDSGDVVYDLFGTGSDENKFIFQQPTDDDELVIRVVKTADDGGFAIIDCLSWWRSNIDFQKKRQIALSLGATMTWDLDILYLFLEGNVGSALTVWDVTVDAIYAPA